jgi:membrane-associated HD superfamily phosphohydrolase
MTRETFFALNVWLTLIGLAVGTLILAYQYKAYLRTKHRSLRLLIVSSVLALIVWLLSAATMLVAWEPHGAQIYWIITVLTTVEAVVVVMGVRSLLKAFEALAGRRHGDGV